jgi:hypothetical protein
MSKTCLYINYVNIPTLVVAIIPLMLSVATLITCVCGMALYFRVGRFVKIFHFYWGLALARCEYFPLGSHQLSPSSISLSFSDYDVFPPGYFLS